jgi:hypothetical protein
MAIELAYDRILMSQAFEITRAWSVGVECLDDYGGTVVSAQAARQRCGGAFVKPLSDGIVLRRSHNAPFRGRPLAY